MIGPVEFIGRMNRRVSNHFGFESLLILLVRLTEFGSSDTFTLIYGSGVSTEINTNSNQHEWENKMTKWMRAGRRPGVKETGVTTKITLQSLRWHARRGGRCGSWGKWRGCNSDNHVHKPLLFALTWWSCGYITERQPARQRSFNDMAFFVGLLW